MAQDSSEQEMIQTFNQLQQAVKKLQRSEVTVGQSNDTLTFRRRIEKELTEAEDIHKKIRANVGVSKTIFSGVEQ